MALTGKLHEHTANTIIARLVEQYGPRLVRIGGTYRCNY